jgi:MFS family permease
MALGRFDGQKVAVLREEKPMLAQGDTVDDAGATGAAKIGWLGQAALLSTCSASTIGLFGMGLTLVPISREFATTPGVLLVSQLVGAIVGLAFAIASPIAGRLIDRFGYRSMLLAGMALFALMGAAPAILHNLYLILATRVLMGFIVAVVSNAGLTGIAQLAEPARTRMFGFVSVAGGLAAMGFFPLLGFLMRGEGWRSAYLLHLAFLPLLLLVLALPRQVRPAQASQVKAAAPAAPVPWGLIALIGLAGLTMGIPSMFSPFLLANIGVTDPAMVSIPMSVASLGSVLAATAFGWWGPKLNSQSVFAVAFLSLAGGFLTAGLAQSVALVAVGFAVASAGMTLVTVNVFANVARRATSDPGRLVGMANGALYGALSLFPFFSAPITQLAGPASVLFAFAVVCALVGGLFVMTLRTPAARVLET